MASFPAATATKPASIVANQAVIVTDVGGAWDEVVALEEVLRGNTLLATAGQANVKLKSGATNATPLVLQGFSGQTAEIFTIGTSGSTLDLLRVNNGGKLHLPVATSTGGLMLGTATSTQVYTTGNDLNLRPGADGTTAVRVRNLADTSTVAAFDTTNLRVGLGAATAPSATLHLSAGATPTTSAFGIQFGSDATNLYRSAATRLKTDNELEVGTNLVFNDVVVSRVAANVLGLAAGDSLKMTNTSHIILAGDTGTTSQLQVVKTAAGNLVDYWFTTNLIGAETSARYQINAAGTHYWTDGTNPATPVNLSVTAANAGLTTNKDFVVTGNLTTSGTQNFVGATTVRSILLFGGGTPKIKQGVSDGSYSGTDTVTLYAKDFEIATTAASTATRIVLKRPDGTKRYIRLDNDDQFVVEAS